MRFEDYLEGETKNEKKSHLMFGNKGVAAIKLINSGVFLLYLSSFWILHRVGRFF